MNKSNSIKFYENGIVSTNLPISEQVIGSRASRSTHPKVLAGFSELFSLVLNKTFNVDNPFFTKTKSDVVRILLDRNLEKLIGLTNSCTHTRTSTKLHSHCGVCSQCIERRIATLYNQVGDHDPGEMYGIDLFLDPLEKAENRVMVESYINHCRVLETITDEGFFARFPESFRVLPCLGVKTSEAAEIIFNLHKRHAGQVATVVERQIKRHAEQIYRQELPPDSLLGMITGKSQKGRIDKTPPARFPLPPNVDWEDIEIEIVSNESVRFRVAGTTQRFTGFDVGFRDGRKKDLLNQQWDTLLSFAEGSGVVNWITPGAEPGLQKNIQSLNKTLRQFFGLRTNPIKRYQKKFGWVARFTIRDLRFGRA